MKSSNKNKYKKYSVQMCFGEGISRFLGSFDNIDDAFNLYKISKENYIKKIANDYKHNIPQILYDAMTNYIIEIDD